MMSDISRDCLTEERVVLITGAARRIGARTAEIFHQQGYRVLIHCHHSLSDAETLAHTLNTARSNSAFVLQADLNCAEAIHALAASVLSQHPRLDVLVNNASSFYATPLASVSEQQWLDLMGSNAHAPLFLCQALAPRLRDSQGSIVNLTDMNINRGMAGFSAYTMAKAALQAMTRSLARELAPQVRVNAVSPGAILWPEHASDPIIHAKEQAAILAGIPMARLGTPDDIAQTVFFLAHHAHYVTGQTWRVDGGRGLS
ncbi:MAG: pteridine reductase [Pseudohongiella sp.]|nr:pteridine reductase [Pseudohongiella sp.]